VIEIVPSTVPAIVSGSSAAMSPVIVMDGLIIEGDCVKAPLRGAASRPTAFQRIQTDISRNRVEIGYFTYGVSA
jgi:hypothetical protein